MRGAGHQVLSGEPFRRTPPPPGGRGGLDGFAAVTRAEAPAAGTGATEGDRRTHLVVAGAIGALVTAVYTVFSLRQWDRFEVPSWDLRSEEHTSELQSRGHLVCRLLLEKK